MTSGSVDSTRRFTFAEHLMCQRTPALLSTSQGQWRHPRDSADTRTQIAKARTSRSQHRWTALAEVRPALEGCPDSQPHPWLRSAQPPSISTVRASFRASSNISFAECRNKSPVLRPPPDAPMSMCHRPSATSFDHESNQGMTLLLTIYLQRRVAPHSRFT
jgi:hypothetical protein